ncbi:nitrous oxide reductase family maturation protein NosD [Paenibacillus sepulcri]|uniref:Right-handed parallel beta-helix repeat-containing protein n=1 Tax=Paenibacillus sepulcri TaxID=359917 RepID=A0ABS7BV55_9BACL|nr:right-handed parallel beta-helix repeat-containing protein [Paenibacillus sepulcri]
MKSNRFLMRINLLSGFPAVVINTLPDSIVLERRVLQAKRKAALLYLFLLAIVCMPLIANSLGTNLTSPPLHTNPSANDSNLAASAEPVRNDTPKIQRMIDQAPSGGKIVIPPGVYYINKNPEHVVYTDYGKSYSALKISKPITIIMNDVIFRTKTNDAYGVFWIFETSDVHLKGGRFTGDALPTDGSYASRIAVLVQESEDCLIENMTMKNFSQGVNLYKSNKSTVRHVVTEYNKGSGIISIRSKNSIISSNTISNSGDGHLSLYGGGEYNTVSNNTVSENRAGKSDQQGITLEAEKYSMIKGNTVTGFYYGIDIKNDSRYCNITQNTATNNRYNIALRLGDPNSKQLPSHNIIIFKNNAMDPRKGGPNAGIYVSYAGGGHIIQGNTTNIGKLIYGSTVIEEDMRNKFVNFASNILK